MIKKVSVLILMLVVCGCAGGIGGSDEDERNVPLAAKARLAEEAGDFAEAVDLYRQALDKNHRLARLHLDLALVLHGMEGRKDYISIMYHYKKYLELRPETEKRKMIENRLRLASQAYAGMVLGHSNGGNTPIIKDLEDQVAKLKEENELLERKNAIFKRKLLQKSEGLEAPSRAPAPVLKKKPKAIRTYKVQHGDTLQSIAVFFYGDVDRADDIYESNKDKLRGPNELIEGQILDIP
ncbi:hypothetical protein BVX97_04930 [bacterium E08(2017)]|nr:hypothetical protein BVX97_04930 [bacterium E08(2017)]